MPLNKLPRLRDPGAREVLEVRDLFLEEYKRQPELYYAEDAELVRENKFLLQRCVIMKRKNVRDSFNMLVNMCKWRKDERIRELRESDFPLEYYSAGIMFLYEPDKFGNKTIYIRTQLLRCIPELKQSFKQFMAFLLYQADDCVNGKPLAVVFDLTNTGWSNYDIDLLMHFLSMLKDYFPVSVDYVLAINFPWILSAAWSVVKRLIPPERRDIVVFIQSKEVFNYIERESTPDFLGGDCKREHQFCPKCPITFADFLLADFEPPLSAKRIGDIIKAMSDLLTEDQYKHALRVLEQSGRR